MQPSLTELISLLHALQHMQPTEGKAALAHLQSLYPAATMKLIWEQQEYDQSFHYDVMIRPESASGVITVGFSPATSLPWPLRGAHRWREADLLRVNNVTMGMQQAVSFLDFIWNDASIIQRLINTCLAEEAIEDLGFPPFSDDELQSGMDAFRRGKGLLTIEATNQWLTINGLSHDRFESLVTDTLFVDRLREHIATEHFEEFFILHESDFDTVNIATISFNCEESAINAIEQLACGNLDFFNLAQNVFVSSPKQARPFPTFMKLIRRTAVGWGGAIFDAAPETLVGPIKLENQYVLARIITRTPAVIDEETTALIKQILLDEWLLARRQKSSIEWYWGSRKEPSPL